MHSAKDEFAAGQCNKFIYVCGAFVESINDFAQVEKFDPSVHQWSMIDSCENPQRQHLVCALQRKIYVVGGQKERNRLKEIKCFDPSICSWNVAAILDKEYIRDHFALFAV